MKKVITYGTYDLLHYGHIRLLERAKELGDYLIVGVTSDDFDKQRGKINVEHSLMERIDSVKKTGLADEIIVEEYEGQKIDDIKKYGIDIFTVGSDWEGKFDYLKEYCDVIYLPRTDGVSSTELRTEQRHIKIGIVGNSFRYLNKFYNESKYVNGLEIIGICTNNIYRMSDDIKKLPIITNDYNELLNKVDAIYIQSSFNEHYDHIKKALSKGKSVLCASPLTLSVKESEELFELAKINNCVLMDAIRTAYSTAYSRLLLLIKGGKIGDVLSIDVVCTDMNKTDLSKNSSLFGWGANALLPIFHILGTNYKSKSIISHFNQDGGDSFTKINFVYGNATASIIVADGAKSEGHLIITGSKGYIYVPAPWWKTDYFEIRFENPNDNKRYFYQLDGEGIRYMLVEFCKLIHNKGKNQFIDLDISINIVKIMEDFNNRIDLINI